MTVNIPREHFMSARPWASYFPDWRFDMSKGRTNLSYLDLGAFYATAKKAREVVSLWSKPETAAFINDLADKLACVIDAIRNDGLDPRWNPERDALDGLMVHGEIKSVPLNNDPLVRITADGAEELIEKLRQRGYKIVKE